MELNLTRTRSQLLQLNNKLKQLCGGVLSIKLYSGNELTRQLLNMTYDKTGKIDFVICLNYNNICISSISCKIGRDNSLEFSSKTQEIYEGNKYNLLLRSALILLSNYVIYNGERVNSIISRAVNPASIYIMVKYFHADNDKLTEYMDENGLTNETLRYDDAKDFYDNIDTYDLDEEEDEEAMAARLKNDKNFGEPVNLIIDLTNNMYIDLATEMFNNIAIKCPSRGGYKNKQTKKRRGKNKRTKKRYNKKN
jgi:hypothetical protein